MSNPSIIKICGLSTPEAVDAAIAGGATHMGLIFFEKSPRHVTVYSAAKLSRHAGNRIVKVAVSVDADDTYLDQIVEAVKPDLLQFHGHETPDRLREIKSRYGIPVMKAIAVREADDIEQAKGYIDIADMFLFDAKAPEGSEVPGGNGIAFDWTIMDQWVSDVPYMLSGGLNAGNVHEALKLSGADAIDISSGVETVPGRKDPKLIREFLDGITGSD
ncbi:MAG: phosphoribosylanthranilate isomerase [Rhizobiaceae bacterium]